MKRLEIIHLRSSGEPLDALCDRIKESIWEKGGDTEVVKLYRRDGMETDIAIHIRSDEDAAGSQANTVALHLVSALRALGLIKHTVWDEVT